MKKLFAVLAVAILTMGNAMAQGDLFGIFNHLAVGAGVGTQGISVDVAMPVTRFLAVRAGVNVMPGVKIGFDVNTENESHNSFDIDADANISRTTFDFMVDAYPFPAKTFFVTGGFSFGGKKIVGVEGYDSRGAADPTYYSTIGDYKVPLQNGKLEAAFETSGFRPYLGLGFGRAVPRHRVGVRFELGAQFMGKSKVTSDGRFLERAAVESDDDLSDLMDKITVYPVLKFRIAGRIF